MKDPSKHFMVHELACGQNFERRWPNILWCPQCKQVLYTLTEEQVGEMESHAAGVLEGRL